MPARNTQVRRELGPFSATSIVVANMIGTGIFTTSGIMAARLPGSGWVMLCWFFGGLIALSGALCYAELATRMPVEGGEYVYLKTLYHPALGFLTGWTSFIVGFSAPIAASALSFAEYILAGLNINPGEINALPIFLFKKGAAIFIILLFTTIHYFGLRWGSRVQNFLTVLKIVIVFGLASTGIVFGAGSWSRFLSRVNGSFGSMAIGTAMVLVMFSYSGWNASTYIAGELKRPRKTLPVSLVSGTLIVIVLYIAVNAFIFQVVPYSEVKGVIPVVELALVKAFGSWAGDLLSLLIALALLSSLSAFILIGPRVYFAMARDRLFFASASKVHARYHVPGRSIVVQGILAVMMVIIGSLEQLLVYLGFALLIFPWLTVVGVFIARRRKIGEDTAVKLRGYPFVPLFFLISSSALMTIAYVNRPLESTAAVLTVIFGIPCYFLWLRGARTPKMESSKQNHQAEDDRSQA